MWIGRESKMAEVFAVVCAWCNRIVAAAPAGNLVTHTICPDCIARTMVPPGREPEPHASRSAPLPPDYFGDAFKQ
jgi:hypothetical protein